MQRLIDECGLTQDALSEKVGKKRSTVSNFLRLLKLPDEIQLALKEGLISAGHAKAIAGAPADRQLHLLKRCIKKDLSVRQIEELVRSFNARVPPKPAEDEEYPESYLRLVEQLERFFSQEISIKRSKNGGGKIVIDFAGDADIEKVPHPFRRQITHEIPSGHTSFAAHGPAGRSRLHRGGGSGRTPDSPAGRQRRLGVARTVPGKEVHRAGRTNAVARLAAARFAGARFIAHGRRQHAA